VSWFSGEHTIYGKMGGDEAMFQRYGQLRALAKTKDKHDQGLIPDAVENAFYKTVDYVSRPLYAVTGFADTMLGSGKPGEYALGRVWREIIGQGDRETWSQLLEQNGVGELGHLHDIVPGWKNTWIGARFDPSFRSVAGFALDLASDPLNWIMPGAWGAASVYTREGTLEYLTETGRKLLAENQQALLKEWAGRVGADLAKEGPMATMVKIGKSGEFSEFIGRNSHMLSQSDDLIHLKTAGLLQREAGYRLVEAAPEGAFLKRGASWKPLFGALGISVPVKLDVALSDGMRRALHVLDGSLPQSGRARAVVEGGRALRDDIYKIFNRVPYLANVLPGYKKRAAENWMRLQSSEALANEMAGHILGDKIVRNMSLRRNRPLWEAFARAVEDNSEEGLARTAWFAQAKAAGIDNADKILDNWHKAADSMGAVEMMYQLLDKGRFKKWKGRYFPRTGDFAKGELDRVRHMFPQRGTFTGPSLGKYAEARGVETWDDYVKTMERAGLGNRVVTDPYEVMRRRFHGHYQAMIDLDFTEDLSSMFGPGNSAEVRQIRTLLASASKAAAENPDEALKIHDLLRVHKTSNWEGADAARKLDQTIRGAPIDLKAYKRMLSEYATEDDVYRTVAEGARERDDLVREVGDIMDRFEETMDRWHGKDAQAVELELMERGLLHEELPASMSPLERTSGMWDNAMRLIEEAQIKTTHPKVEQFRAELERQLTDLTQHVHGSMWDDDFENLVAHAMQPLDDLHNTAKSWKEDTAERVLAEGRIKEAINRAKELDAMIAKGVPEDALQGDILAAVRVNSPEKTVAAGSMAELHTSIRDAIMSYENDFAHLRKNGMLDVEVALNKATQRVQHAIGVTMERADEWRQYDPAYVKWLAENMPSLAKNFERVFSRGDFSDVPNSIYPFAGRWLETTGAESEAAQALDKLSEYMGKTLDRIDDLPDLQGMDRLDALADIGKDLETSSWLYNKFIGNLPHVNVTEDFYKVNAALAEKYPNHDFWIMADGHLYKTLGDATFDTPWKVQRDFGVVRLPKEPKVLDVEDAKQSVEALQRLFSRSGLKDGEGGATLAFELWQDPSKLEVYAGLDEAEALVQLGTNPNKVQQVAKDLFEALDGADEDMFWSHVARETGHDVLSTPDGYRPVSDEILNSRMSVDDVFPKTAGEGSSGLAVKQHMFTKTQLAKKKLREMYDAELDKLSPQAQAVFLEKTFAEANNPEHLISLLSQHGDRIAAIDPAHGRRVVDEMLKGLKVDPENSLTYAGQPYVYHKWEHGPLKGREQWLPKGIAQDLENYNGIWQQNPEVKRILAITDFINNTFRLSVTKYFPSFNNRNWGSNLVQSAADINLAILNPETRIEAMKILGGLDGTFKTAYGETALYAQLRSELRALGINVDHMAPAELVGKRNLIDLPAWFARTTRLDRLKPVRILMNAPQYIENEARAVHYLTLRRRGYSPVDAAMQVNKFLFDYTDLSPTARNVFRRIFPFWTWTAKNVELQWDILKHRPGFIGAQGRLLTSERGPHADVLPDYLRGQATVKLRDDDKGTTYISNIDLPIQNINILWAGSLGETMKGMIGMVHPLLKMPFELAYGMDSFTGQSIRGRAWLGRTGPAMNRNLPPQFKEWLQLKEVTNERGDKMYTANGTRLYLLFKGMFLGRMVSESARLDDMVRDFGSGDTRSGAQNLLRLISGLQMRDFTLSEAQHARLLTRVRRLERLLLESGDAAEFNKVYIPQQRKVGNG